MAPRAAKHTANLNKADITAVVESARAVTIAAHAAAALAGNAGVANALRALRSAEALGRAATSIIIAHFRELDGSPDHGAAADVPMQTTAKSSKKRRNKGKNKDKDLGKSDSSSHKGASGAAPPAPAPEVSAASPAETAPGELDDSWADSVRGRAVAAPGLAAPAVARVLRRHGTGSRSPRGSAHTTPAEDLDLGPVSLDGNGLLLSANSLATIKGIDSRKELNGQQGFLVAFYEDRRRWQVQLTSGEKVMIHEKKLFDCLPP